MNKSVLWDDICKENEFKDNMTIQFYDKKIIDYLLIFLPKVLANIVIDYYSIYLSYDATYKTIYVSIFDSIYQWELTSSPPAISIETDIYIIKNKDINIIRTKLYLNVRDNKSFTITDHLCVFDLFKNKKRIIQEFLKRDNKRNYYIQYIQDPNKTNDGYKKFLKIYNLDGCITEKLFEYAKENAFLFFKYEYYEDIEPHICEIIFLDQEHINEMLLVESVIYKLIKNFKNTYIRSTK